MPRATSSSNRSSGTSITLHCRSPWLGSDRWRRRAARGPERRRSGRRSPPTPRRSCILAGAGSGKTRVLTRRIAYRASTARPSPPRPRAHVHPQGRRRAAQPPPRPRAARRRRAGTFHAVAYAQLRGRWADRGMQPPALLDRKVGRARLAIARPHRVRARPSTSPPRSSGPRPGWSRPTTTPRPRRLAGRRTAGRPGEMADLYQRYEDEKRARRLVDFDDLLAALRPSDRDRRDFAAAQRWRFRHLFVDEFQDVNPLQFRLLERWLGDRRDLCVVGDPNQAIYSWNGADPRSAARLRAASSRARPPWPSTATTGRRRRSSPPPTRARLGRGPRACDCVPLVPTDRCRPSGSWPTIAAKRAASPEPCSTATVPARPGRTKQC